MGEIIKLSQLTEDTFYMSVNDALDLAKSIAERDGYDQVFIILQKRLDRNNVDLRWVRGRMSDDEVIASIERIKTVFI